MTWTEAKIKAAEIMKTLRAQFPPEAVRLILRALSRQHQKDKAMNRLDEEKLSTCDACHQDYDLTTEDPQFPGLCRECGDKKRETNL
jgi:stress-induced morphogen